MALTAEQIQGIYASRRTKGQYVTLFSEFLASGENGVSVKEAWPMLKDKKANTLKQGFEGVKEKKDTPTEAAQVDVIVDGEDVYLINRALVGGLETEAA